MARIIFAATAAALLFTASAAIAADEKMAPQGGSQTNQTGPGAGTPPGQPAGSETSDRSPDKKTTTPESQTTTSDGATSDRTPEHHGDKK